MTNDKNFVEFCNKKIIEHPVFNYIKNFNLINSYENAINIRKKPDYEKLFYDQSVGHIKEILDSVDISIELTIKIYYPNIEILEIMYSILEDYLIKSRITTKKSNLHISINQEGVFKMREMNLFTDNLEKRFQNMISERRAKGLNDSILMRRNFL